MDGDFGFVDEFHGSAGLGIRESGFGKSIRAPSFRRKPESSASSRRPPTRARRWIPAFAGMTNKKNQRRESAEKQSPAHGGALS
jgi:hypothetical protein